MGKKSSPKPDPQIGEAAKMSAQLGRDYLGHMKDQSAISNAWADEDRTRYKTVFEPVEDRMIADAQGYDTPERRAAAATAAMADVHQQSAIARAGTARRMAAMGVNPASGAAIAEGRRSEMSEALGAAGAANLARNQVEAGGEARIANVVNMGKGLAVNPLSSLTASNSAMGSGFQGAMGGYNQQGSLLNMQFQQQLQAKQMQGDIFGGVGQGIGMLLGSGIISDEKLKTAKRREKGVLKAIEGMPAERWRYKPGVADEAEHVGPYAQDFKRATGLGDGKTINPIDMMGVTLAGVQELAREVRALKQKKVV